MRAKSGAPEEGQKGSSEREVSGLVRLLLKGVECVGESPLLSLGDWTRNISRWDGIGMDTVSTGVGQVANPRIGSEKVICTHCNCAARGCPRGTTVHGHGLFSAVPASGHLTRHTNQMQNCSGGPCPALSPLLLSSPPLSLAPRTSLLLPPFSKRFSSPPLLLLLTLSTLRCSSLPFSTLASFFVFFSFQQKDRSFSLSTHRTLCDQILYDALSLTTRFEPQPHHPLSLFLFFALAQHQQHTHTDAFLFRPLKLVRFPVSLLLVALTLFCSTLFHTISLFVHTHLFLF